MPDIELVSEQDLARTYDGGDYDDTWTVVQQYRRVRTFAADNPTAGVATIAAATNTPTGRVDPWVAKDTTPRAVQALYTAHEHDWIGVTYDDITPLNVLVANVYAGGTIPRDKFEPEFTLRADPETASVVAALELAGVGWTETAAGPDTSQTVAPAQDGAVLGRVLAVLGAPVGAKTEIDNLSLPWYLEDAPESVRKRFVDSYLENRALTDPTTDSVQIMEDRPQTYLAELGDLIASVAGEPVTVGDRAVTLSASAARALGYGRDQ
ncbi:hypothetical protein A6E15_02165 [Natrinema saccharevitans]|uniref:Uncharacterized protein n=1 Tax=Natrinema saccharevitans TaxID=301967 RepID=A0A1S8AT05_9EURY|nr:hypothetical protein [Natrinema saccharevitans]OLZ39860.1 hypothetical protein A6E15_02165 [Natrinema saccharevitans]